MLDFGKDLKELCGRVAKEDDPAKLRELITELSRFMLAEDECGENISSTAEGNETKKQNPTK
jgi:hypothetical protein